MAVDLQIKSGDTRDWEFTLSDSSSTALNLTGATVAFQLRKDEGHSSTYFVRNTGGTGSDYISIDSPASDGTVSITPTTSDWTAISDCYGIYVGEFKVTDSNSVIQFTQDVTIDIQEALV